MRSATWRTVTPASFLAGGGVRPYAGAEGPFLIQEQTPNACKQRLVIGNGQVQVMHRPDPKAFAAKYHPEDP